MKSLATLVPLPTLSGYGPLGSAPDATTTTITFASIISTVLGVLTVSAGLWFMFQVFAGALSWLGSGGDKQALENAKKRLTNAVTGLLVVVLSYAIISVVSVIFGIPILNIAQIIISLKP